MEKEIIELKAQAYDAIGQIELWQKKLNEINSKILELQSSKEKTKK